MPPCPAPPSGPAQVGEPKSTNSDSMVLKGPCSGFIGGERNREASPPNAHGTEGRDGNGRHFLGGDRRSPRRAGDGGGGGDHLDHGGPPPDAEGGWHRGPHRVH